MQLISKYSKGIRYLLGVIDIFSKYTWVIPLKDKKCVKRKPNKKWIDRGSEFYNSSFKKMVGKE